MKRLIFVSLILFAAAMAYAQTAGNLQTPDQVRQNAQPFLNQARANAAEFETLINEITVGDMGNRDAATFERLRTEITRLETRINLEKSRAITTLENNGKVNNQMLDQIQRLIDQHRAKIEELEAFIAG